MTTMMMATGTKMNSSPTPFFSSASSSLPMAIPKSHPSQTTHFNLAQTIHPSKSLPARMTSIRCVEIPKKVLRTCKNCKTQFDPALNHPRACRYHTAHFGGETKRKFESVYTGGTMNTPDSGRVFQYWHCCGSEDPFDAGCTASPHRSYDE